MYVYIETKPFIWTVGFFDPKGNFVAESKQTSPEVAAKRVAWLNGKKLRNIKKALKSVKDPIFTGERLTVQEFIETLETKLRSHYNKQITSRLINVLKYLSNTIVYTDEISEDIFFTAKNSGSKSWFIFQELLTETEIIHKEYINNNFIPDQDKNPEKILVF